MISSTLKRNTILLYISYISRYLFPIILIPYLTRVLGFEDWGKLIFYIAYAAYIESVIEYGFDLTATRDISIHRNTPEKVEKIISNVITTKLLLSIICLLFTLGLSLVFESLYEDIELFFGMTAVSVVSNFSMYWYYKGIEKMSMVTYLTIISYSVSTVLVLLFINSPEDIVLYPIFFLMASLLVAFISLRKIFLKYKFYLCNISECVNEIRSHFHLFLVRASGLFFINGNIICVSLLYSDRVSAYFSLSIKIVHSIRMLLTPIVDSVFPNISNLIKLDMDKARHSIMSIGKLMIWISIAMTITTFFLSELLVLLFAGVSDLEVVNMLKIFSILPIIVALTHIIGPLWMLPIGQDLAYSKMFFIGVFINIILLSTGALYVSSIYLPIIVVLISQAVIPILMYAHLKKTGNFFL